MKNVVLGFILTLFFVGCNSDDDSITNNLVAGEWQVVTIHNSSPTGPTLGPNEGEVISVNFARSGALNGTTSSNTFGGEFSVSGNTLSIGRLYSTEVAETPFGIAFFGAFSHGLDSSNDLSEFELVFENDDQVNLTYRNFMFLSLQRP